jgi:hypothetical protein
MSARTDLWEPRRSNPPGRPGCLNAEFAFWPLKQGYPAQHLFQLQIPDRQGVVIRESRQRASIGSGRNVDDARLTAKLQMLSAAAPFADHGSVIEVHASGRRHSELTGTVSGIPLQPRFRFPIVHRNKERTTFGMDLLFGWEWRKQFADEWSNMTKDEVATAASTPSARLHQGTDESTAQIRHVEEVEHDPAGSSRPHRVPQFQRLLLIPFAELRRIEADDGDSFVVRE